MDGHGFETAGLIMFRATTTEMAVVHLLKLTAALDSGKIPNVMHPRVCFGYPRSTDAHFKPRNSLRAQFWIMMHAKKYVCGTHSGHLLQAGN